MSRKTTIAMSIVFALCSSARAARINIHLPANEVVTKGLAISAGADPIEGTITADGIQFSNVIASTLYDIALTLKDGSLLQGVNLGWYSLERLQTNASDLNDDDKQQINDILKTVLSFYNKNDILLLNGNHNRATALVQLVRDKAFHSDAGDEVIWHIELWYFKNQHGGWEKVQQANKILRRERFPNRAAYQEATDHLKWMPELGGLKVPKDTGELTVDLKQ